MRRSLSACAPRTLRTESNLLNKTSLDVFKLLAESPCFGRRFSYERGGRY